MISKKSRRAFSPEFNHEAAAFVLHQGYRYKQACESLDLTETAQRGWAEQQNAERGGTTPTTAAAAQML